ncbi:hypothetical protein [Aquabacterium sp.]|uniref:hypothetical protein n=1 Tax=Aquabacterium sp. TaxID=1872578 RepID=UPI002C4B95B4|nr:hypothetical protein [Aquabacterium sp.]HSW06613.1 hypothetical protein [Aquabacterium sp.]
MRCIFRLVAPLLFSAAAAADPGYYVVTAYDNPGQKTVDLRYWTVDKAGAPATCWPEVGFGWNVNGRWHTGVLASYRGSSDEATELSTLNWQNDLLLTAGQYPFDLAIHTLLVKRQRDDGGHAIEFGPVLQTDIGRTQLNFNALFERGFGAMGGKPTQLKYQWQVRHRWQPWLHFGVQGFGELGEWKHWAVHDMQSHRAGPALFGKLALGEGTLHWQAAYLSGSTYRKHGNMVTVRVHHEF